MKSRNKLLQMKRVHLEWFSRLNLRFTAVSDTVVVKKLEDQKEFIKEKKMLHQIKHDNVLNFKALCQLPHAILLEYLYFDFSLFGDEKEVHTWSNV